MAKLTCSDGTVVEISKETEAELKKAFGPKPEPKPIPKFGDIVVGRTSNKFAVMLYDKAGVLCAHKYRPCRNGSFIIDRSGLGWFTPTIGQNIFTNNLLGLDQSRA
jgi:hypothetical protein